MFTNVSNEVDLRRLKLECLVNHWLNLTLTLNSILIDHTKVFKGLQIEYTIREFRRPATFIFQSTETTDPPVHTLGLLNLNEVKANPGPICDKMVKVRITNTRDCILTRTLTQISGVRFFYRENKLGLSCAKLRLSRS